MHRLTAENFEAFYSLLCDSFPPDERRGKERQKALFDKKNYAVYARCFDSHLTAMAVWDFGFFRYIEHFASDAAIRGKGFGSSFLQEMIGTSDVPYLLEVEPPEDPIKKRRIAFYERNGMLLQPFDYFQPPLNRGDSPIPLLLMATENLTEQQYSAMRKKIYQDVYQYTFHFIIKERIRRVLHGKQMEGRSAQDRNQTGH